MRVMISTRNDDDNSTFPSEFESFMYDIPIRENSEQLSSVGGRIPWMCSLIFTQPSRPSYWRFSSLLIPSNNDVRISKKGQKKMNKWTKTEHEFGSQRLEEECEEDPELEEEDEDNEYESFDYDDFHLAFSGDKSPKMVVRIGNAEQLINADLHNLWAQFIDRTNDRKLFISKLYGLPPSVMSYNCCQFLHQVQENDFIKLLELRKMITETYREVHKKLDFVSVMKNM
ncbi:hypothetical protein Tco_0265148 [Tanacetum coccineum]